jgi:hypothetical protein
MEQGEALYGLSSKSCLLPGMFAATKALPVLDFNL